MQEEARVKAVDHAPVLALLSKYSENTYSRQRVRYGRKGEGPCAFEEASSRSAAPEKHWRAAACAQLWDAAFAGDEMVGLISAESNGGYWLQTGAGADATCFINEFVVNPAFRGKRIGFLGAAQTFNDGTDVMLLTTNLFRKAFASSSHHVVYLEDPGWRSDTKEMQNTPSRYGFSLRTHPSASPRPRDRPPPCP